MKAKPPILLTSRLKLRPMRVSDAEVLNRINQAEGVLRYFPGSNPPPLERVQRFITGQQQHWQEHGYGNWGIVLAGRRKIIGWAGLQYLPELGETEVGFLLDRPYWGKGYATEAALASLKFGFDHCSLHSIIALVHPHNLASRRVLEKCGMVYQHRLSLWGMALMRYTISH